MIKLNERKRLMDVAAGRIEADLVITGAKVVDVFNGKIIEGDVAVVDGLIAGIGTYRGLKSHDAKGRYLAPGFIDAHVHIESSLVDPPSFASLVVPHGTTTVIADPHEICNVCGLDGLDYMLERSDDLDLSVFFMIPSCVPATAFEHAGAVMDASHLKKRIGLDRVLGLGEMMDTVGTVASEKRILKKLDVAYRARKIIDGHAPGLGGLALNAYAAAGIKTDHECASADQLRERIRCGMYVMLREGSACHDLRNLLSGVDEFNSRYCLFCTDDRQPRSIIEEGHLDNHLRIAVEEGIDPLMAIRMATINAAECYGLHDRGAIAPGRRADLVLLDDLHDFKVCTTWCRGIEFSAGSRHESMPVDASVSSRVDISVFSEKKLRLKLSSPKVRVIDVTGGSVVTGSGSAEVLIDEAGLYRNDPGQDIVKLAVVERHLGTGNVGLALIRGYGLRNGAVATTIAHDSHNIIVAGDNDADMSVAVYTLGELGGGIVMVQDGSVIDSLPLPIAGLMTNLGGHFVHKRLLRMHEKALKLFGIHADTDPFMTLSFMALPVIGHLKVTDLGLFDVDSFSFVPIEL